MRKKLPNVQLLMPNINAINDLCLKVIKVRIAAAAVISFGSNEIIIHLPSRPYYMVGRMKLARTRSTVLEYLGASIGIVALQYLISNTLPV